MRGADKKVLMSLMLIEFIFILDNKKPCTPYQDTRFFSSCRRPESNRYGRLVPQDFKSCASACSATPAFSYTVSVLYNGTDWVEKDSNLRSRRQQIYSLPPLAAREPTHALY